jgi:hypothetical protein
MASDAGSVDTGSLGTGIGRGRRRTAVQSGLGDTLNEAQYQRDKRTITTIINKDRATARHFAFLIETDTLSKKARLTGEDEVLSSCTNKLSILDSKKTVELLLLMDPVNMEKTTLEGMRKTGLTQLLAYAVCASDKCALPSKHWGTVKAKLCERYEDVIGNRLEHVVFLRRGDDRVGYFEVDWEQGGCFELVKGKGKNKKFIAIRHVSTNATAKLKPNLDESYKIENNNKEAEARLVSRTTDFEACVLSIFVKQDLANLLPSEVCLHRVGPYNTTSPNKGRAFSPPLAIADIEGASAEKGWGGKEFLE